MKFTCSSGQKPLDGYTLKRGIGCGGFGEVYYAVSDGGKEVALKLVRGQQDIELRGIAQCLNLKHPNLVHLFDLRNDPQGDHWVVMEYVTGESLSAVLNRHPDGLPRDLAIQWFSALAKGVSYLHDHGIVHRDLKPANIFLENGILKIGDYGLSKFISSSARTAQTQSVGTVYYMAPEISTGNYNKQIDIYAAGIILYEMLTGKVPFDGESAGEILMKHLTSPPDLSKLPADFVPIVGQALAKNPATRYATMAEMTQEVERLGTPVNGASVHPERNGKHVPNGVLGHLAAEPILTVKPAISMRGLIGELSGSMAMAVVLAGLMAILYAAVGQVKNLYEVGPVFFLTVAISWSVMIPAKFWNERNGDSWTRRLVLMLLGAAIGLGSFWLNGWMPDTAVPARLTLRENPIFGTISEGQTSFAVAAGYLSYFALALCLLRWWKLADRYRPNRFSCFPVLAAGFWALVLFFTIWPTREPPFGAIALTTSAVILQWVSPWEPPRPPASKRLRLRSA